MGFIYKITNYQTLDFYIGKTTRSLEARFKDHVYNALKDSPTHLHRAIKHYGPINFKIELLEETDNLDTKEKTFIKELKPAYNMTDGGEGGDTSKSPRYQEALKKRKSFIGEANPMYGRSAMKGRKHSALTIKKQSIARKKMWDNLSKEERLSRSSSGKKNGMFGKSPKNAISLTYNGVVYNSIAKASKETGISQYFIRKHINVN